MTWLYGPLHQAPADPPTKISSVQDKLGIDELKSVRRKEKSSSPPNQTSALPAKPILKRRSITDILAMAVVPPRNPQPLSSPIYECVSAELEAKSEEEDMEMESESTLPPAAGVLQASSRPPLWQTKSDSIVVRQHMGAALSTSPMSIHGLTPPKESTVVELAESVSLSPSEYGRPRKGHRSDSSSSYQVSDDSNTGRVKPTRHISFNSFVEQRIVVDPVPLRLSTVYARSSSESGSDEEDEDTILQMRSSSGSSISSGRRGSSNSTTSLSDTPTNGKVTPHMTMTTAPIAPTLLKEPDHLPAPSPAVVFVAPQGVDEETLKYEVHAASRSQFAVQADRRRAGSTDWPPNGGSDWNEQTEMADYFANVPLSGLAEPDREPIYTDEDDDAITVRRRKGGIRSPRLSRGGIRWESSPPETVQSLPLKSSFSRKAHQSGPSTPPIVSDQEVARSMARYGTNIREPASSKPLGVPRRIGSSSDLMEPSRWSSSPDNEGLVGSGPHASHLSASMSSMRSGTAGRSGNRNRQRGTPFEGVDLEGHTSALSARSGSSASGGRDMLANNRSASLFSPPRGADLGDARGRTQRINEDLERPRRGRSLLRANSSSTVSERERSSTTSSSPIGSLSPRSNSSVGIVGGYIVPPNGIGAIMVPPSSSLRGSGLRFESGSWDKGGERRTNGGGSAQAAVRPDPPSGGGGLVHTSDTNDAPMHTSLQSSNRSSGIRRSSSSTTIATKPIVLQRPSSSSNITDTARQSPQLITSPINNAPTLTLQPPSSDLASFPDIRGGIGDDINPPEDSLASNAGSLASHSLESTGSFWHADELERQESPATSLSPANSPHLPPTSDMEGPSLPHDLLLAKGPIKPRASGMSLASSASNESNSSTATVMPPQTIGAKRRSTQLASASSSLSSGASTPPAHRRSGSKSSLSTAAPPTPPSVMRSNSSSSIATRLVTPTVATRSEVGSHVAESEKHLRRLSGGISTPNEEKASSTYSSSQVSPGFVLSNVVESAKGLLGVIWGGEHSG